MLSKSLPCITYKAVFKDISGMGLLRNASGLSLGNHTARVTAQKAVDTIHTTEINIYTD